MRYILGKKTAFHEDKLLITCAYLIYLTRNIHKQWDYLGIWHAKTQLYSASGGDYLLLMPTKITLGSNGS